MQLISISNKSVHLRVKKNWKKCFLTFCRQFIIYHIIERKRENRDDVLRLKSYIAFPLFGLKWIDTIIRLHGYYVIIHRNEFSR